MPDYLLAAMIVLLPLCGVVIANFFDLGRRLKLTDAERNQEDEEFTKLIGEGW